MKEMGHLEETNTTYFEHWWHGLSVGIILILCGLLNIIDAVFPKIFQFLGRYRKYLISKMYLELMRRWHQIESVKANRVTFKERKSQRSERILYLEKIEKENIIIEITYKIKYFSNLKTEIKNSAEWIKVGISSVIHSFFPEILIDDAALGAIRIYLRLHYSKYEVKI